MLFFMKECLRKSPSGWNTHPFLAFFSQFIWSSPTIHSHPQNTLLGFSDGHICFKAQCLLQVRTASKWHTLLLQSIWPNHSTLWKLSHCILQSECHLYLGSISGVLFCFYLGENFMLSMSTVFLPLPEDCNSHSWNAWLYTTKFW